MVYIKLHDLPLMKLYPYGQMSSVTFQIQDGMHGGDEPQISSFLFFLSRVWPLNCISGLVSWLICQLIQYHGIKYKERISLHMLLNLSQGSDCWGSSQQFNKDDITAVEISCFLRPVSDIQLLILSFFFCRNCHVTLVALQLQMVDVQKHLR